MLSTKNSVTLQTSLVVYLLPPFEGSLMKKLSFLLTLMQVYRAAPFLCLKALFMIVVHTRLEQIMWDGSVQGRKMKCIPKLSSKKLST